MGGSAGLADELGEDHGGAGVALRGLEDEGVAGHGGNGDGPERDHGGEVLTQVLVVARISVSEGGDSY